MVADMIAMEKQALAAFSGMIKAHGC